MGLREGRRGSSGEVNPRVFSVEDVSGLLITLDTGAPSECGSDDNKNQDPSGRSGKGIAHVAAIIANVAVQDAHHLIRAGFAGLPIRSARLLFRTLKRVRTPVNRAG